MSSPTPKLEKKRLTHIQFSGLGGHLREFATFSASPNPDLEQSAIFLGNVTVADELVRMAKRAEIPYAYVPKPPGAGFSAIAKILTHLWRFRPDIILVRSLEAAPVAWLYRLAHPHCKIVVVETQWIRLKSRKQLVLSRFCMIAVDAIVVLNESYRNELRRECGRLYRHSKVHVISNGIDITHFCPAPKSPKKEFCIGMQSRLAVVKDHPTLLRAFAAISERLSDGRIPVLKIAGSGDQEAHLRNLVLELGIRDRVQFLGELSTNELIEMMQSLDLYVQATHGESFCFSVMEALSVGLPVLTSDLPVLNQTLASLSFVGFYKPGDEESLAQKILEFSDPTSLETQGQKARNFARSNLDEQSTLELYVNLFQIITKS